jgi:hypothetical protein
LLKDVSQAGETISKDNGLFDLPLYLALLDGSLSFCEQPSDWPVFVPAAAIVVSMAQESSVLSPK